MKKITEKLQALIKLWNLICDLFELIIAIVVTIAIAVSIWSLIPGLGTLLRSDMAALLFSDYLEEVFSIVIGIEFLKMLCHPNSDNVLETLIFLVARHMIINTTTPFEDLISVFTIVMLVLVRRFLTHDKEKRGGAVLPLFSKKQ